VLSPKLLEILACPRCKGPLTVPADHAWLDCAACRLRYRVEQDIPILLIDEAAALPAAREDRP